MLTQAPPPGPALGGPPEKPADDEQSRALAKTCIVEAFRKLDPSEKGWVPRHAFVQVVCLLFFPLSERDANKLLAASGALTGKDECVNYLLFAEWIMSVPRTPRQEATVEAAVVEAAVVEADPGAAAPEGDDLTLSLSKPLSEQTWLPSSPSPQHGSTPPEGDAQESSYECMEGEQQKSAPMKASIGRPVVDVAAPAMQQKAAPPPAAPAGLTPSQLAGALEDLARRWEAAAPEARLPQEEAESFFGAGCAAECAELLRRWHAGSGTDAAALAARYPDDEGGRRALLDDAQALAAEPLVQEADRRLRLAKYARRPPKEVEWQRPPSEDAAEEDFDPGSSAARIDLAFARMLRTWDQASDEVESSPRVFSKDERGTPSHSQFAPEPPPSLQKSAPPPPRAAPTVVARAAPVEPPAQQAHTRAGRANQAGVAVALRLTSLLQEEVMCGPEGAWADRLQASTRAELGALLELLSSPSAADLVDLLSGKTAAPPPLPGATD